MTRRIAPLTQDNLEDLPLHDGRCRTCVFWELDAVQRSRAEADGDPAREKADWLSRTLLEWGSCGRVAYVDDTPAGYALFGPPALLPGGSGFPTAPASEDAVLLATVRVLPEFAGAGLGRVLMQSVVKDVLERRDSRAIEAFGDVWGVPGRCVMPVDYLLGVGFKTHRAHARFPRMRLELRSVVTWREEVEHAIERLLGAVRPRPVPAVKRISAAPPSGLGPPHADR